MADKDETKTKEPNGTIGEVKTLVTDYAKQETVEPLKNLAKWAGLGVAGAVMLTIGALFMGLGILRLFQKWDWTEDGWSFAPYLMVFAILIVCAGACFWAASKTPEWMDDDA